MTRNSSFDSQSLLLIDTNKLKISFDTSTLHKNSIRTGNYVPLGVSTWQVVPVYRIPALDGKRVET